MCLCAHTTLITAAPVPVLVMGPCAWPAITQNTSPYLQRVSRGHVLALTRSELAESTSRHYETRRHALLQLFVGVRARRGGGQLLGRGRGVHPCTCLSAAAPPILRVSKENERPDT